MALEGLCLRHRPAAASEGQAELRGGTLRKSKAHAKERHPWRSLSCPLQAFACRLIAALDGHRPARTAPHSWADASADQRCSGTAGLAGAGARPGRASKAKKEEKRGKFLF